MMILWHWNSGRPTIIYSSNRHIHLTKHRKPHIVTSPSITKSPSYFFRTPPGVVVRWVVTFRPDTVSNAYWLLVKETHCVLWDFSGCASLPPPRESSHSKSKSSRNGNLLGSSSTLVGLILIQNAINLITTINFWNLFEAQRLWKVTNIKAYITVLIKKNTNREHHFVSHLVYFLITDSFN